MASEIIFCGAEKSKKHKRLTISIPFFIILHEFYLLHFLSSFPIKFEKIMPANDYTMKSRSRGKDKSKRTYEKYGKHTQKHIRQLEILKEKEVARIKK
mgnify:CR=1 FL=1